VPTLPTLIRIALVFAIGLEQFFQAPVARPFIIVCKGEQSEIDESKCQFAGFWPWHLFKAIKELPFRQSSKCSSVLSQN
jgi:hypothetical protein